MDLAAWLRNLGLERYEPAFRDNEITANVLPDLTEDELTSCCSSPNETKLTSTPD